MFFIAVAIAFGVVFTTQVGGDLGAQYFAGYLVEKSLSIDNLFVFVIIMTTFAVPEIYQQKVLIFGIAMALVMRGIFIALGAALLELFSFMFLIFLAFMVTWLVGARATELIWDPPSSAVVAMAMAVAVGIFVGRRLVRRQFAESQLSLEPSTRATTQ